jgi:hypothetical protein|tara:strand:+ start:109 stop:453 length:345 start_codon:yes stop_codon:yes gene_type:complete
MNKTMLSVLALTVLLAGCAKQTFVLDGNNAEVKKTNEVFFSENILDPHMDAKKKTHEHFFLSGIGQGKAINPVEVCGSVSRISKVEVQQNFLQAILSGITFGIYAPREARVYCK